ncbi:MAG: hypothetical protein WCP79_04230 [Bacillota bacterium]
MLGRIPVWLHDQWRRISLKGREGILRGYMAGMALFLVAIIPGGTVLITPVLISFFNVYIVDLLWAEKHGITYKRGKSLRVLLQLPLNFVYLCLVTYLYFLINKLFAAVFMEPLGFSVCYYLFFRLCRRINLF